MEPYGIQGFTILWQKLLPLRHDEVTTMRDTIGIIIPGLILVLGLELQPENGHQLGAKTQLEKPSRTVLVIHGGAGVLTEKEMTAEGIARQDFEEALARALSAGSRVLEDKDKTCV